MSFAETIQEMSTKEILILGAMIIDMLIIGFCLINLREIKEYMKDKNKQNIISLTIFYFLILFAVLITALPIFI